MAAGNQWKHLEFTWLSQKAFFSFFYKIFNLIFFLTSRKNQESISMQKKSLALHRLQCTFIFSWCGEGLKLVGPAMNNVRKKSVSRCFHGICE